MADDVILPESPQTTAGPSLQALQAAHWHWTAMRERWKRYRAFTCGGLETRAQKAFYLPKGEREMALDYGMRIKLTQDLSWSQWAVDRLSGVLTKAPAKIGWPEKSIVPQDVQDAVALFITNADGTRRTLSSWWGDAQPEVLMMGIAFAEVARQLPTTEDPDPAPFLTLWKAEEVQDWKTDDRGDLEWVLLARRIRERRTWTEDEREVWLYRILTREEGFEYRADTTRILTVPVQWRHNLGIVPGQPIYARRCGPLMARSYIDAISRADLRILQLESDQAHASYLNGSPQRKMWTNAPLDTIGADTSEVIKLQPGDGGGLAREDIEYLTLDGTGMELREAIIERTTRQALTQAGIDPSAVIGTSGAAAGPRSGTSIAWSFSTAEAPTLSSLSEEMDCADRGILEILVRYLTRGKENAPPSEALSDAVITRAKQWDMMAPTEAVDLGTAVFDVTPSELHRKAIVKHMATVVPPNLPQDMQQEIFDEIDASDLAKPEPVTMLPPDQAPADGMDGAMNGAAMNGAPKDKAAGRASKAPAAA